MRTLMSVAFLCLGLAAIPAAARADDAVAAKAKYESGVRHFDLSEYESALADFKEAYRQKPDPAFLYNIAQCHRKLGHTDEAITFYQTYLRRAPDAKNREEVERRISELETLREAENASIATSGRAQPPPSTVAGPKRAVSGTTAGPLPIATQPGVSATLPMAAEPPSTAPVGSPGAALDFTSHDDTAPKSSGALYQRWWFWTAVGAVAAGAATVAIIMAERDPTKVPTSGLGAQRALP